MSLVGTLAVHAIANKAQREFRLHVEGLEHVPAAGPAIIAARHYHHLHDGAALVRALPRTPYFFVALDWTRTRFQRFAMETLCALAEWPVALRPENLEPGGASAFAAHEVLRYTRSALERGARLLARGDTLVVFPEGHPTIDPVRSRKDDDAAFLPFRAGTFALAARAERMNGRPVPIVPAGLAYRRSDLFDVTLRFGAPLAFAHGSPRGERVAELTRRVRELSA
jgi:1-acyl-sn-glycerol-3-phosphate acyltransferase